MEPVHTIIHYSIQSLTRILSTVELSLDLPLRKSHGFINGSWVCLLTLVFFDSSIEEKNN